MAPEQEPSQARRDIVVLGASMGGVEAIERLVGQLPADFPAAVFVVQHLSARSPAMLPAILNRAGRLEAGMALDAEAINPGRVYVAPPNQHLLVRSGRVRVVQGPRENGSRPAIDPLFRSAAVSYGPRVVAVLLTGLLDDGSAGLGAVRRCGGVAVVQDPLDAAYPDMPRNALDAVGADYVAPLDQIAPLLIRLVAEPAGPEVPIPADLIGEVDVVDQPTSNPDPLASFGSATSMVCPDCGGSLRQMASGPPLHYRCHVGHAYTEKSLLAHQDESVEGSLWAAMRSLEERAMLLVRMAREARDRGQADLAAHYEQEGAESSLHAAQLGRLVRGTRQPGRQPS